MSNFGCLLWGKAHSEYNESTMGYLANGSDNFEWGISKNARGWTNHNLVDHGKHDEERLMAQFNVWQFISKL